MTVIVRELLPSDAEGAHVVAQRAQKALRAVYRPSAVPVFERFGFRVVSTEPACGFEAVGAADINEAYMEMTIDTGYWPTTT
jgi:hypothetical protein